MNINTIEPQVLLLFKNLNRNLVQEVVKYRSENEITKLKDLSDNISGFPTEAAWMNLLGVSSSYYSLKMELMNEDWSSSRYFDIVFSKEGKSEVKIVKWEEM
jgi:hypothetical protein